MKRFNLFETKPGIPKQNERRVIKIVWLQSHQEDTDMIGLFIER